MLDAMIEFESYEVRALISGVVMLVMVLLIIVAVQTRRVKRFQAAATLTGNPMHAVRAAEAAAGILELRAWRGQEDFDAAYEPAVPEVA